MLLVSTVEAIDDRVLPPSISSSENALDIPESVDTESTAAGPENTLVPFVDVGWTIDVFSKELKMGRNVKINHNSFGNRWYLFNDRAGF